MADIRMQMEFRRDIDAPLLVQPSVTLLKEGDSEANLLLIRLYSGKEEADVSGSAVSGYLLRADGARVPLTGSAIGNTVTVTLNEHCYLVPGPYGAFVRLINGTSKRTILEIAGEVKSEGDGPVVDAGEKLITLDDIIAQMNKMVQITEQMETAASDANAAASGANAAASAANTAAGKANTATENANAATSNANNAATRANTAAATIENMTVSSENVGPDTAASAAISTANGKKNIHFKLRQGQKGDTGATPAITFKVTTGAAGTDVQVSQSGTAENPVVNLTIPRGDTGAVEGIDYYTGNPAALGTASPGTANGLARGDHVHPMPTAAQVGALAASGTAANSTKFNGKTWAEMLVTVYPVGSIYLSVNSTSPASLFGGTWTQLQNRFLLGAGDSYSNGATGGEEWHTLTESELPLLNGDITFHGAGIGKSVVSGVSGVFSPNRYEDGYGNAAAASGAPSIDKIIFNVGGGGAHNNLPPYLAVYMWKRVS